jgi:hypothetical protein
MITELPNALDCAAQGAVAAAVRIMADRMRRMLAS